MVHKIRQIKARFYLCFGFAASHCPGGNTTGRRATNAPGLTDCYWKQLTLGKLAKTVKSFSFKESKV